MSNETKNKHTNTGKPNKSMIVIIVVIVLAFVSFLGAFTYQEIKLTIMYPKLIEPIDRSMEAGDYDSVISQIQSIKSTHPKFASKYKDRIGSKHSEARNLKVDAEYKAEYKIRMAEKVRILKEELRKKTAALVDVIKSSSGENRQMMLKKLLELDPDTKEFPEEMIAVRRLKREEEARAAIEEKERKIREVKMKISSHFAYDGSHIELTQVIKDSMLRRSTYHHIETTIEIQPGNSFLVKTTFLGKNSVYTTVENTARARLNSYGDIESCSIRGGAVMGGYRDVE